MTKSAVIASLLGAALIASPAEAADVRSAAFGGGADRSFSRPFMFGGATVRLVLGSKARHQPELALRLSGATRDNDLHLRIGDGLAFSAFPGEKPLMRLDGRDARLVSKRLGMSGGATALVVIGGLVLVGGIVAVAAGGVGDAAAAGLENN